MVHLHVHTDGSTLDGMCDIKKLVKRAKELNMSAIAITDHARMVKAFEFQEECLKEGIKPIIGCEFYLGEPESKDNYHLICLAKNKTGLKNLYKLNTFAYMKNFYRHPRITWDKLFEHKEGLIVTTACVGSYFSSMDEPAEHQIVNLNSIFGDDFYLELQSNDIPMQAEYNKFLIDMSKKYNIKTIVTCDVHYINKEDFDAHDTYLCMQVKKKKQDNNRFKFSCNDFYLKDSLDCISKLIDMGIDSHEALIAVKNTHEIADKVEAPLIETGINHMPRFNNLSESEEIKLLGEHLNKKFPTRYSWDNKEAIDRVFYELKVINQKGYAGYFLIVEDFIEYAKKNNILTGPGRGSAAGSIIAYILGITNVDPLKYGLLFERMLNPDRNSLPDIDSDIDYEKREEVIEYVINKYGKNRVAQIIAEGTLAPLSVLRKVLSVYDYPQKEINRIAKTLNGKGVKDLKEAYESIDEFREAMKNRDKEYKTMLKLQGLMSHESKHAAGVVITPTDVDDYVPCMRDGDRLKTQWHKEILEKVGVVKFDFLGLKTLSIIRKTLEYINKNYNTNYTIQDIQDFVEGKNSMYPLDYNFFMFDDLSGIFQFDAPSAKEAVRKIKPKCFDDIVAATALCRPGVIEADMYYENKPVTYDHPIIEEVLSPTRGAIVFQEQTMLLMNRLTGGRWSLGKADKMRKVKDLEEYREDFVNACVENGISKDIANKVFSRFDLSYSFNKSHAVCYSIITCICAWLKQYYYKEFMAATMSIENLSSDNNLINQIKECRRHKIKMLVPDFFISRNDFVPTADGILYPLTAIKNVGDKVTKWLDEHEIEVSDFEDLVNKLDTRIFNKRVMINLIKAGAFNRIHENRSLLLESYFKIKGIDEKPYTWCKEVCMYYEKEVFGTTITHNRLDRVSSPKWDEFQEGEIANIVGAVNEVKVILDKNNNKMAFVTLENNNDIIELIVFSRPFKRFNSLFIEGNIISCKGKKEGSKMLLNEAESIIL